jgi:pilus assembly protein Flp/PilA
MRQWLVRAARFLQEEDGPTAVEYAIMLALIITVCFLAIVTLGSNTNQVFSNSTLNNTLTTGS